MTQTQIVKAMAEACEVSNAKACEALTFLSDAAIKEVKGTASLSYPALAVWPEWNGKRESARIRRETIKIAANKVVKFRIAKSAKTWSYD
jgi:DNA-binding protein HU-beta